MATPPTPPPSPAPAAAPAPAKGGNRTVIIILCVLGGLMLLIGGCVVTCTYFAAKKAKEYSRQAEKNPAFASLSLLASMHPDVQVVSKDEASGKITLRNKKTGETTTFDTTEFTADNIGRSLEKFARGLPGTAPAARDAAPAPKEEESAPPASGDHPNFTLALSKFPKDFPVYDGASVATLDASESIIGALESRQHIFTTSDSPETVAEFYQKKLTAQGYAQLLFQVSAGVNAVGMFGNSPAGMTLNFQAEVADGKTKVTAGQVGERKP